jgi:hypothetical protein
MATKKILVEKEESVGEVIDRILGEPDNTLLLVVPKGSMLGKSARNFHLIEREAADAGKEISVESVDENILAFAKNAGMTIGHPLLRERGVMGTSGISDIVPVVRHEKVREAVGETDAEEREVEEPLRGRRRNGHKASLEAKEDVTEDVGDGGIGANEEVRQEERSFFKEEDRFFKKRPLSVVEETNDEAEEEPSRGGAGKWIGLAVAALVVFAAILYGITIIFGSAKINITFKKTPWSYTGNFTADKAASRINAANNVIPAQIFSVPKNLTQLFPASGHQNVSLKAQGTVTIYNAYSSSPQTLVATTRFVTPAGKVFRLVNTILVPGAVVTNGVIVPSSIDAAIIADQAGPDYNVSSTPKLTIPGFSGTPKYNAFYGSIASGTSGGYIGEKAVPTAADITAAKQAVTSSLMTALQGGLVGSYTNNFKILPGATTMQIIKLTVNTTTDETGRFSVFGEGTLSAIGFDETAFKAFLLSLAQQTEASSTFNALALTYATATPNFTNGTLGFSLNAQGSLEPTFSVNDFSQTIAGKKISDAKDSISALPELQEGTISVWPAWLWQIPGNPKKIQMTVD